MSLYKNTPHEVSRARRVQFLWSRQFFPNMCGSFSPNSQHHDWNLNFLAKKNSQKVWWNTLNAVLTYPPNFLPDVHNPSRFFPCSKNIVPLIAKPWPGGIQLWRTSSIFSRNPGIYRQNTKKINFSRQQAKSFLLIVQTLWQKLILFFPNFFTLNNLPDKLNSCLETQPKKSSEVQITYTLYPKITLGNLFFHKINLFSKWFSGHV